MEQPYPLCWRIVTRSVGKLIDPDQCIPKYWVRVNPGHAIVEKQKCTIRRLGLLSQDDSLREGFVVRISKVLWSCIIGLALSTSASAEIYKSKDAQGNTVYSDKPSNGAAAVKLPPTNSADPVAVTPRPPPPPDTPESPATHNESSDSPASSDHEETDNDYLYYGGNNDGNDDQTRREERQDNDGVADPKIDRPIRVQNLPAVSRPVVGGGGRR
jgi:hypothetical protein